MIGQLPVFRSGRRWSYIDRSLVDECGRTNWVSGKEIHDWRGVINGQTKFAYPGASGCRSTSVRSVCRSAAGWWHRICSWRRWVFAAAVRAGVPPGAASGLVRMAGSGVPAFWRDGRRGGVGQRAGAGGVPWSGDARGALQPAAAGVCPRYWDFEPRAWAPHRARTESKDERGIGYRTTEQAPRVCFAHGATIMLHPLAGRRPFQ